MQISTLSNFHLHMIERSGQPTDVVIYLTVLCVSHIQSSQAIRLVWGGIERKRPLPFGRLIETPMKSFISLRRYGHDAARCLKFETRTAS